MSNQENANRVAIVTGSSRGIGRACTVRLAAEGLAVVVTYLNNADEADSVVADITSTGGTAIAAQVNVGDEQSVANLFQQTIAAFGGVDVVVHAAGIMNLSPIAELDIADLDQIYQTNIRGTFLVDQQATRHVRPGGAIINFSTSVKKLAFPGYGAYAASKGAVDALSLILAKELRGKDITVNAVAPGPTATELFLKGKDDATIENLTKMPPLERLGTPDDIGEVVALLAGAGRWINGQVIYINGGIV